MNNYEWWSIPCKYGVDPPTREEIIYIGELVWHIKEKYRLETTLIQIGEYMRKNGETEYKLVGDYLRRSKLGKINKLSNVIITQEQINNIINEVNELKNMKGYEKWNKEL